MTRIALFSSLFSFIFSFAYGQVVVQSGPMPGYTTMESVGIWLQLSDSASVAIKYWDMSSPNASRVVKPSLHDLAASHVAQFHLTGLNPGTKYGYEVLVDGKAFDVGQPLFVETQPLWQYREDPPRTRIALGSCAYINEPAYDRPGNAYGSNYSIFDTIAAFEPDVMLWLGDNVYLREYDFSSWSGYLHRYTHTRATPGLQRLLRSTHHYAIWDDHDFGPNDANGSWIHKDWAADAFELFWMNPSYGIPGVAGVTTAFRYNDVDFFLLDNRTHRTSHSNKVIDKQILGKEQIEWLIESLKYSNAPFKFVAVGGQVINPARVYENHAQYEAEREYLLSRIVEEKIKGVVFLTGDRHHTEMRKVSRDGIDIYDITISPLTSGVHDAKNESSEYLIDGTIVAQHNFGVLDISGERLGRTLKVTVYDAAGSTLWSKQIKP